MLLTGIPMNYYLSIKMLESAPNTHVGDLCYKAIWNNQDKPCKNAL